MRKRVYLYIVKQQDLLVLRHVDFPELGLQIPGGTVEVGEAPVDAAAREAFEETGLPDLGVPELLETAVVQSQREDEGALEAWFYCIAARGAVPSVWRHTELHAGESENAVRFELFWLSVTKAAEFLGDTDCKKLDAVSSFVG